VHCHMQMRPQHVAVLAQRFSHIHVDLDRGSQFTLALWDSLCSTLGIKHVQTTAYHPQAYKLVEQFHQRLKDVLCARLAGPT
jgi:hypothetical protein